MASIRVLSPLFCLTIIALAIGCTGPESKPLSVGDSTLPAHQLAATGGRIHTTVVQREQTDHGKDGIIDITVETTSSLDPAGNPVTISRAGYTLAACDLRSEAVLEYNQRGNLVHQESEIDYLADGTIDAGQTIYTTAADHQKNPRQQVIDDIGAQGVYRRTIVNFEYDQKGRPVGQEMLGDDGLDGSIDTRIVLRITYDPHGNPLAVLRESHHLIGSMSLDIRTSVASVYDEHGALIQETSEWGRNNTVESRQTMRTIRFDAKRNPVERLYEADHPLGGGIDERTTRLTSYDDHRRVAREIYEFDAGARGWRRTITFQYSGPGLTRQSDAFNAVNDRAYVVSTSSASGTGVSSTRDRILRR